MKPLLLLVLAALAASPAAAQAPPPDDGIAAPARSAPSRARGEIRPYLEYNQVVSAELNGGDTLTYSVIAAGVDGHISTRRVEAQASYRYERQIGWNGDLPDTDIHTGIAQVRAEVVPGTVSVEAGALAARIGTDGRGTFVSDRDDAAQIYSVYAGPSLATRVGDATVTADYRLGYARFDDDAAFIGVDGARFEEAVAHIVDVSIGMEPGPLPIGWTVAAGHAREESGALDNRFEGTYVRGDVVAPVSPTFAVTAGAGYERLESSVSDVVRDADGVPVITPRGDVIADPDAPRLLAYSQSGFIWDVGIIWRPSPRTELQARVGQRYGGTTFIGTYQHRINGRWGVSAHVYDSVDTFGRLLTRDLNNLPPSFSIGNNPLAGGFGGTGGCVFGTDPGSGVCFDEALRTVTSATFRHRGAGLLLTGRTGVWDVNLGAGYAYRRYFRPVAGVGQSFGAREDRGFTVQGGMGRALSRASGVSFDAYASWYDTDLPLLDDIFTAGATASYYRLLMLDRLRFQAALGLYTTESGGENSTIASGLVGLRYTF